MLQKNDEIKLYLCFCEFFSRTAINSLFEFVCMCANPVWQNNEKPQFWKGAGNVKEDYAGRSNGGSIISGN
jgi:hypothetical protein